MRIQVVQNDSDFVVRFVGEEFVEALTSFKRAIPPDYRKFDGTRRAWMVKAACGHLLSKWLELMGAQGADILFQSDSLPEPEPETPSADYYKMLHLLPTAPPELVRAAYRCLAMLTHPDRGGSHEEMIRLNAAYSELVRELGACAFTK